jgi:hypothetical protein
MRLRSAVLLFAITIASSLTDAAGFDISFYETPPTFPPGRRLNIVAGVNPGIPVVFDLSEPDRVVLRPAAQGETPTEAQPLFQFEWREDKSARFYRLTSPILLAELSAQNATDTQTTDGKDFEQKALQQYLRQGEVLRTCLPPSKPFRGSLTFFIVVGPTGKLNKAIVRPEGSVAECILEQAKEATFASPPGARTFTAKADIRVTP